MAYSIDLSDRVALVTGASGGLGAQFAKSLASAGARVVLASRRIDKLNALREQIEAAGGAADVVECDVTAVDSIKAAVERAESQAGPIDILVNNSGVSLTQRLQDVGEDDYDFIFHTNVRGAFFVAQQVAKRMIARYQDDYPVGGRIINTASMLGHRVLPQLGVYSMSKAAVVQMTKAMALEWGRYGINVNAICPGYISSEMNAHLWHTEQGQKLISRMPRKRVGEPQDLEAALLMLASEQSRFMNGATVTVDDGFTL